MITITTILVILITSILFYMSYRYAFKRPEKCAPGPPRIPIFGSYLFLLMADSKWLHKGALLLSKIYNSDVISLYIGSALTYVVHCPEGVKEILNNSAYDGRAESFLALLRDPNHNKRGIFFQEGPIWKEQRRFIIRYLRDFGFGRRFQELELVINEEIKDFIDLIKNGPKYEHEKAVVKNGKIFLPLAFSPFIGNCMFHVIFNERIPRAEQDRVFELGKNGLIFQRHNDDYGKLLGIVPWIRHLFPEMSSYRANLEANTFLHEFFDTWIGKYMKTYDEDSERNFVDLYLKQMHKEQMEGNLNTTYLYDQLVVSLIDFSIPAFTGMSSQISLIFQWMLLRPDVLKKVQIEIDEYVGSGRLPCLDDRKNLHYTEATIREGLRMETLVPSDVPHQATQDTEFLGYQIKKGTIMVPSLYAYHYDKRVWNDPENFMPERFLDKNGKLSLKSDVSLPFSAGKRVCPGETFARNLLFLLFASLCQNFNIILSPGEQPPDMSKNNSGFIITPPDFWVTMEPR
ncbi:probable cytochrome P450 304a1 [Episyrphus balteatus]|uniref:probable cytochrome P450 304a1 n=1 Tax=Episyrphus balteatus TaxID=286459 RepID=UPI0024856331|nr:probable cytochrome P450 304a1 [Episyrphus balteatus]